MVITSNTAGITVPTGTIIVSITNDTAVLSNNVTGSGTPTFSAIGPSDTAAEDGGIIVKGTTDKTFLWKGVDGGVTYNSWLSSEHLDLATGKNYYVNGIMFASDTNKTIGPTNGSGQGETTSPYTLGSAVTGSSLTNVGTLNGLVVGGTTLNMSTSYISFSGSVSGTPQTAAAIYRPADNTLAFSTGNNERLRMTGTSANNGEVHVVGGVLKMGTADSSSAHLNSFEVMTFNIDSDNDDTNRYFAFYKDGSSGSGTELLKLYEDGNLEPGDDNTQNLGASDKRWANVYSGDVHLNNTGMGGNEVDGSEGSWTMQEGADDLFLINRITGKKYKFNLTEV